MGLKDNLKKIKEQEKQFDPTQEIASWVNSVDEFYKQIELWFKDLIDEGLMKLEIKARETSEELLGEYTIRDLEISLGNRIVILEPFATNLIGSYGAIDMYMSGFFHDKKVILKIKDEKNSNDFCWVFRKNTDSLKFEYDVITKETLEKIFEEWTR